MSSDARMWPEDPGGWMWVGSHDGPCHTPDVNHAQPDTLRNKVDEIETCMVVRGLRWVQHENSAGLRWLRGWMV